MDKQIINAAIREAGHCVDHNGILYVSKSFQTNANFYGTTEYRKMNEILAVYPDMKIELYAPTRKKRLTYEMKEAFIRIMPDAEENFAAYTRVRKMSVAYKSPYKYMELWFNEKYPFHKEIQVEKENGDVEWDVVALMRLADAQKKEKEAQKAEVPAQTFEVEAQNNIVELPTPEVDETIPEDVAVSA